MARVCVPCWHATTPTRSPTAWKAPAWADETLVILDTRSDDGTADIARLLGARVVERSFDHFAGQRNFGPAQTDADWLFYLDSDERATPALGAEIRERMADADHDGWWVPRRNFFWGHEIRHAGWYPDCQLRLIRVGRGRYDPERRVHEIVQLDGAAGTLREPLIHYNYRSLAQFAAKQRQYVAYEAGIRYERGTRPHPWTYLAQPLREFWRYYVALKGYRDGFWGLVLCTLMAYYYGWRVTVQLGRLWRRGAPTGASVSA